MSKVIAFTDGASSNNQNAQARRGGWAAVLMLVNEQNRRDERPTAYKELSGKVDGATGIHPIKWSVKESPSRIER